MNATTFSGVIPAVVTPLLSDERLAVRTLERLIQRFYEAGCHGVYVCGLTGEGLSLPVEVRKTAAEIAVRNTPRGKHAIIHVGAASTVEAVALARHAAVIGAHGISSLPPPAGYRFEEVKQYYCDIAACAGVPVLVYYFPEFSESVSAPEHIIELCSVPGVVGLKYTDFDLYRLWRVRRAGPLVFNGRDEVFIGGLLMGADGGIGSFYNLVPELFVRAYELSRSGNWGEARTVQDRINRLIEVVLQFPLLAAIKHLLRRAGLDCGAPVKPRRPLTDDEVAALERELAGIGFDPYNLALHDCADPCGS